MHQTTSGASDSNSKVISSNEATAPVAGGKVLSGVANDEDTAIRAHRYQKIIEVDSESITSVSDSDDGARVTERQRHRSEPVC